MFTFFFPNDMALFSKSFHRLIFCKVPFKSFRSYASKTNTRKLLNKEYRTRLAAAYRGLDLYGLNEGICNHLSAIAPAAESDDNVMLIIPFGLHWNEVTPSLLIGIDENDNIVEGKGEPEVTAFCIHKGIYKKRPDVKSVMHTHMPYATALTCLENPQLLMIHQNSARFYKRIAYTSYSGLGDSSEEGERLGDALGDKSVLFMGNHGVMTVAETIDVAFDNMYYLERAAMFQVLASSSQQRLKIMDDEVLELTSKQIHSELPQYAKSHLNCILRQMLGLNHEFSS